MIAGCFNFVYHHFMVMNSVTIEVLGILKPMCVVDCNRIEPPLVPSSSKAGVFIQFIPALELQ